MKPTLTLIIALFLAPLVSPTLAQSDAGQTITLADDGRARCQIVAASDADGIEDYAAQTLAGYLKEMTGAEFPVVSPDEFKVDRPAIFVGLSEPALARLGPEPLAKLRDQERVARSVGHPALRQGASRQPRCGDGVSRKLARLKTLAYRRSQAQIPPRLPEGKKLPGNLIIDFSPIEDCYFADWTHPDPQIQETFQHLKDWTAITAPGNLWAWMYPNPWGTGHEMPVGNVERVVTNMRLMHKAGVRGIFLDHHGVNSRSGWSELQAFLVLKLSQDINAETDALIADFRRPDSTNTFSRWTVVFRGVEQREC